MHHRATLVMLKGFVMCLRLYMAVILIFRHHKIDIHVQMVGYTLLI